MVIALRIIGALAIIGGFIIGINLAESDEYFREAADHDWVTFFTWLGYGVIAGVLFLAFAELLNQSEKQTKLLQKMLGEEADEVEEEEVG